MHTRSMLRDGLCAACLLALCLAACAPPTLGSRALAQHAGAAAPHTASSVVPLTAYAAAGSLSLPAADVDAAPGPAAVQGAPGPASAAAPSRAKADKRPPVHRTMDPLTPERRALAFVADNRPAPEEEGDDEGSDSKADDSHDDADAAAPSAGADAHWAVPGTGAPERRDAQVGANPGGRPGHAGGVQTAASVRLRGGAAERDEFAGSPAPAPGANTAALIGMGSAFGVLGGGVGASFNFGGGGGNVARGEASTPPLNYHGGSVLTQPVNVYLVMCGPAHSAAPPEPLLQDIYRLTHVHILRMCGAVYFSLLGIYVDGKKIVATMDTKPAAARL